MDGSRRFGLTAAVYGAAFGAADLVWASVTPQIHTAIKSLFIGLNFYDISENETRGVPSRLCPGETQRPPLRAAVADPRRLPGAAESFRLLPARGTTVTFRRCASAPTPRVLRFPGNQRPWRRRRKSPPFPSESFSPPLEFPETSRAQNEIFTIRSDPASARTITCRLF